MLLSQIIDIKLPFVIFKKPNSGKLNVWQQKTPELITDPKLQTKGFYFYPYDPNRHPVVVFPSEKSTLKSYFIRDFNNNHNTNFSIKSKENKEQKRQHIKKVKKAIRYIEQGVVDKIIISRKQIVRFQQFDYFALLLSLVHHYDKSFVYLWHHPEIGTWAGASPEKLGIYKNDTFSSVALAGTLPANNNQPVVWSNKEIKEQQFVSDYIAKKLSQFSNDIKQTAPKTVFQANIAHIQTDISASIPTHKINEVIKSLHPTPAVCGLPVEKAKQLIYEIEEYDRNYYTGFLGNITDESAMLYVNLRCMQIFSNQLMLYVGGGIVKNSEPEKEWKETQIKASILLSLIKLK